MDGKYIITLGKNRQASGNNSGLLIKKGAVQKVAHFSDIPFISKNCVRVFSKPGRPADAAFYCF
ncbi:hypothetical protein ABK01_08010 [Treponema sp. OMZ 305]|nr:hypothetical protein ABK01_08010 [Treponema sp. OMZ 305]